MSVADHTAKYRSKNRQTLAAKAREYYYRNKETVLEKRKAHYEKDPEAIKKNVTAWQSKNKERVRKCRQLQWKENPKQYRAYGKKYRKSEKGRGTVNAKTARRRAAELKATPKWADLEAIKKIYTNCPIGMHVDHEIPLKGENVCGLHVENNLQYLSAEDNVRKSNKF